MLKFVPGRSAVKFHHQNDQGMTVAWDLEGSLEGDELLERLRSIVAFMDTEADKQPLPQRTPDAALLAAREKDQTVMMTNVGQPANGWAGMPPIPARLDGEVELIPPEEQS